MAIGSLSTAYKFRIRYTLTQTEAATILISASAQLPVLHIHIRTNEIMEKVAKKLHLLQHQLNQIEFLPKEM
jgi:hypothetical protein